MHKTFPSECPAAAAASACPTAACPAIPLTHAHLGGHAALLPLDFLEMFCSRRVLQQWCFALFLLCSPVPHYGRPIDALSNRM
ncbi:hypothetical protein EPR50_G00228570 [Perca flavescens]|uniref:Uncharacterized protein n=1 Tax=Perca flavescens TaxID=8167 RepID=A0A484C4B5_PERFV|nr:hypothetical protein EPR50_G00228570 [Perca flavescens]